MEAYLNAISLRDSESGHSSYTVDGIYENINA